MSIEELYAGYGVEHTGYNCPVCAGVDNRIIKRHNIRRVLHELFRARKATTTNDTTEQGL
ncbi:hypothetical protein UFOVP1522_41 [uncultured Caudovirales phage]|uniref:Uncharacterized protein n=1 Tax=uncultured Caudovirales phage TaxID=2100421 RepID=A0A6J5QFP3_9CAUD|nr:hypothetical protein UFOVP989_46 [uncultured Caudovirales phage]CAB4181186.1 hypothetical protein UFOVP1075_20 [uncultured Caudovirales phage]CAB4198721.1 hypothetical protein UFOVP1312_12 [uncultured Caudovirales phage]CAB4210837.1 hypothetical protein UFOVP1426_46 [uncultured Caudovirales phage]CAB5227458.1 hypothetical protein UFOVP1522_41 [uncultured Caudovirales phage]